MAKCFAIVAFLFLALFGAPIKADAAIISFDDLTGSSSTLVGDYNGISWFGFYSVDPTSEYIGTGGVNSVVSGPNVAYANPLGITTVLSLTPFTLNSAYFTSGYGAMAFFVESLLGGVAVDYTLVTIDDTKPTYVSFNWANIDQLIFFPVVYNGPTLADVKFIIDDVDLDMAVSTVPLPAALPLFGAGVLGFAGWARKKRAA